LHHIANMSLAVVNWHGTAVQFIFLAYICTTLFSVCV